MAVDPPVLYNDWMVYLRRMVGGTYGSSHLNPSVYQVHNAYKMRAALQAQGYDETAIAGVIGNAQVESGISPGAIEKVSALPNGATTLSDVPNSYMLQYYTPTAGGQGYGLGLLQWDRYSAQYHTQDLLGWEDRNGYVWYDGDGQMARLYFEFNNDSVYHFWTMNYGPNLDWNAYRQIETTFPTYDPGEAANVWASCWEKSSLDPTGRQYRRDNAQYWYDLFNDEPDPPDPPDPPEPPEPGKFPLWLLYKYRKERKDINVKRRFFI